MFTLNRKLKAGVHAYWPITALAGFVGIGLGVVCPPPPSCDISVPPDKPANPYPAHLATNVPVKDPMTAEVSGDFFMFQWDDVANACKYDLYYGADPNSWRLIPDLRSDTSFYVVSRSDPNYVQIMPGTTYYWKVVAHNNNFDTSSDVWSFTTGAEPACSPSPLPPDLTTISTNKTIPAGCWTVPTDIVVNGGILTIEPGATLQFSSGTSLNVNQSGALKALGTATAPIIMTGQEQVPGYWGGVLFRKSNSLNNLLSYVTIEYGGADLYHSNGEPANLMLSDDGGPVLVDVKNCTLRHSGGYGFFLNRTATLSSFNNSIVTDNVLGAAYVEVNAVGQLKPKLGPPTTYSPNDVVTVEGGEVEDPDKVWPSLQNASFLLKGNANLKTNVIIDAGANLKFESNAELIVQGAGSLKAIGTASAPILFTGKESTPGYWGGVLFHKSNSANNLLAFVTIEYGGGAGVWVSGNEPANLMLSDDGGPVLVDVKNCTLRHSGGYGLLLNRTATLSSFNNSTVTDNVLGAAFVEANAVGQLKPKLGPPTTYSSNDVVKVMGGDVTTSPQTWPALHNASYLLINNATAHVKADVTIEAGAALKFGSNAALMVEDAGSLTAVGTSTPEGRIRLTGKEPIAGYWRGVAFVGSNSPNNRLDYVSIGDGGGGSPLHYSLEAANLALTPSSGAVQATVTHCEIYNSGRWGIYIKSPPGTYNGDIADSNGFWNNHGAGESAFDLYLQP